MASCVWLILSICLAQTVKNLPAMQAIWVQSLGQEDPLEKGMATHPSILAGEFHGQRSLVGYSPQGGKEQETTEQLTHTSICYRFVHLECLFIIIFCCCTTQSLNQAYTSKTKRLLNLPTIVFKCLIFNSKCTSYRNNIFIIKFEHLHFYFYS